MGIKCEYCVNRFQSTEGAWEAKLEKTWENEKVGKKMRKIWEIYGSVVVNQLLDVCYSL